MDIMMWYFVAQIQPEINFNDLVYEKYSPDLEQKFKPALVICGLAHLDNIFDMYSKTNDPIIFDDIGQKQQKNVLLFRAIAELTKKPLDQVTKLFVKKQQTRRKSIIGTNRRRKEEDDEDNFVMKTRAPSPDFLMKNKIILGNFV